MGTLKISSIKKSMGNTLFMLFILILTVDPTGSILHLKNIAFILLVGYNMVCFRPDFSKLPLIVITFAMITFAWIMATIQEVNLDLEETMAIYKSVSPMILLLWVREYDLLKLARLPIILTSLLVTLLFWIIIAIPELEGILYYFFSERGEDTIMMSSRSFLGIEIFAMYYKSLVSFILVLAFYITNCFNKERRNIGIILAMLIIANAFIVSGSRSTMLLPFFLFGMIAYRECKEMRYFKYIFYPVLFFIGIAFIVLLFLLIMEKDEASNAIKYGHLYSYLELFQEHPSYLLFGQGPGSSFYSIGFGRVTDKTEWTYLELIRYFGCFSVIIIYAFYRPLVTIWKNRKENLSYAIFWGYLSYLMIAGTNPLLLSSTGMLVLLIAYSYESQLERKLGKVQ